MATEALKKRAEEALSKRSAYGIDLDVSEYMPKHANLNSRHLEILEDELSSSIESVGLNVDEKNTLGSYIQIDQTAVYSQSRRRGLTILNLKEALKRLDFLRNFYWRLIPVDLDKFTALAALYEESGYVIVVEKGFKSDKPTQACLLIRSPRSLQTPHNIIIAEEETNLHVITGCTTAPESFGLHVGISEFYIGRNATVTFTMIHSWSKASHVRPRTAVLVEDGGRFISNYVVLKPATSIQMYPSIRLIGENASAISTSVILGSGNASIDVGSSVSLESEGSNCRILSRVVGGGSSETVARSRITAVIDNVRGHTECNGIIVSDNASITAIPELEAKAKNIELTHEAAIGKISEEEIFYLQTRGFTREEAVSLIIGGFLESGLSELPANVEKYLKSAIQWALTSL
ncbi:SufD family Fe-S cluster assembly protein [Candidatus Bathyarchaeota archaeon]|nr:SufD family Fe-S cluster assembly protein [Candidatus Bathyarchaeota archaeon]MBS7613092.1 SufD family Fe-S cluster assembly protein [Candidatus Bathyarchaeota archaeon]MBS7617416.1 SufD family Fe-S cluster assembly protein [Candidatus Bathyarchaeota archaeon]